MRQIHPRRLPGSQELSVGSPGRFLCPEWYNPVQEGMNMAPVKPHPAQAKTLHSYTARYVRIESGYMGHLVEWPEVISEGPTLDECRAALHDALHEMILACRQLGKEIPTGGGLLEQVPVEI